MSVYHLRNCFIKLLFLSLWLLLCNAVFAQVDVYPTHWWVGMKNPKVAVIDPFE